MFTMKTFFASLLGLCLIACISAHVRQEVIPPNRCRPGQSCFPSRQTLAIFASTLTGSLLQPSDVEYRTYATMVNNRLTRHPYIIVVAADVGDVQKAMKFARKHQLHVTSQATNNEYSGRSTYDGAMMINLSRLVGVPSISATSDRNNEGEITVNAGTPWRTVYEQANNVNRDVVGSYDLFEGVGDTVGDGGIGPLVKIYGLSSDNLLEARVVTPDGNLVTVDEYTVTVDYGDGVVTNKYDRSLFAALTAGGIGPFGIVVSYTFKLHARPASIVEVTATYKLWEAGDYVGQNVLSFLNGIAPILPDTWGGYMTIDGTPSTSEAATKGLLRVRLFYYGVFGSSNDYFFIEGIRNFDAADSLESIVINNKTSVYNLDMLMQNSLPSYRGYSFSTFLQESKLNEFSNGDEMLSNAMLFALNNPTIESSFNCFLNFLGGASQVDARNHSYTNPAARSSFMMATCTLVYPDAKSDSFYIDHLLDFASLFDDFSEGKYMTYVETDLADWKKHLHGSKYGQLIETKIRYDIDNFLWCHNCVGSDFRLDCRYPDHHKGLLLSGYVSAQRAHRAHMKERNSEHKLEMPFINRMKMDD